MTTKQQVVNHYEFISKPAFPIVGKLYPDSVDWTKDKVSPYSLAARHSGVQKTQTYSDKSRPVITDSTYNTRI